MVWQCKTTGHVFVTTIDVYKTTKVLVPMKEDFHLGTATAGPDGQFYYVMIQKGSGPDKETPIEVNIALCDFSGNQKMIKKLNTSKEEGGLNYWKLGESCMMAYSAATNTLALHISRTMTVSADGLNHQGAVMFMYEADTLEWVKDTNYVQGQTSGHSFANCLTITEDGKFTGMDLGDNYPRGINFWAFEREKKVMNLVYQFKTLHGKSAKSPAGKIYDKYEEISAGENNFYKWSNDN